MANIQELLFNYRWEDILADLKCLDDTGDWPNNTKNTRIANWHVPNWADGLAEYYKITSYDTHIKYIAWKYVALKMKDKIEQNEAREFDRML